jgi:hypothetical protein
MQQATLRQFGLSLLAALAAGTNAQSQPAEDGRTLANNQDTFYRPLSLSAAPDDAGGGGGGAEGGESQEALF